MRLGMPLKELIIVMGIIVVLAYLFRPTPYNREIGRSASCQSNLKQIGLALAMYRNDYDDTNVRYDSVYRDENQHTAMNFQGVHRQDWVPALYPYVKNTQVFICPSALKYGQSGYELNINLSGIKDRRVGNPAGIAYVWDSTSNRVDAASVCGNADPRHEDGFNVLFYDGHVKWLPEGSPLFDCSLHK